MLKTIIILGIFTVICGFAVRIYKRSTDPNYYLVTAVNRDPIVTKSITEKDGCIVFDDEFGKEIKICGTYEIEKI